MQPTQTAAQPQQQVPTQQEVTNPQGGIQIVVGSGETASNNNPPAQAPQHKTTQLANTAPPEATNRNTIAANTDSQNATLPRNVDPIIQQEAQKNGETLVPIGTKPDAPTNNGGIKLSAKGRREYEVLSGDSLSKIAQKFYGSSNRQYRDAIVAANPSLKADPNRLIAGVKYVIPAIEMGSNTTAQNSQTPAVPKVTPKVAESSEHFYTVKAGDNLWAIARDQCGDTAALAALKELNKDALKGGDGIRVGMKLRLPTKPVASIN
jgi:LysM repeat protein